MINLSNFNFILPEFILFISSIIILIFGAFSKSKSYLNINILKIKIVLVTILIGVAIISIPIISLPGDDFMGFSLKFFKHGLEWNYFLGVITFYFLTFLMWKKN